MYTFEDLKIGNLFHDKIKVNEQSIKDFSNASGDKNPIHLDEEFAKKTIFKERIAHGMLIASFISSVIGNKFPGPGTIYVSQSLQFKKPVKINDIVDVEIKVNNLLDGKKWCELSTRCYVKKDLVLDGNALVIPPRK